MKKFTIILSVLLAAGLTMQAKVKLPSVISDNMVLQQKTDAALWGTAAPGKKVTIKTSWDKSKTVVTADSQTGAWSTTVATPEAGGPYEITISDGEAVTLKDVLIGEVWFCSGQSNMEMPVKGYGSQPARNGADYIINANESRPIRICAVKKCSSREVLDTVDCKWYRHNPDAVANASATAYFFAEQLQKSTGVPVGIIVSSWGGSSIETWIDRKTIEEGFPEFDMSLLADEKAKLKANGFPSLLYNGQVNGLVPYTFKGMIWYQGEANRSKPDQYVRLQTAYVKMMRELFKVPDAPFYFVQIAPYNYNNDPNSFMSGYFYEAQQKTLKTIPHSGMAVTCDVGEYGTIHPCRKQEVGKRLAMLALRNDYGYKSIVADAPTYRSVEFKDGKAFVKFNVDGMGLSPMGANIAGFEVAGADKVFHKAAARLNSKDHSIIEVKSNDVAEPVAVRYCFRNWCVGGLYNNFGVPAAPFRTDDWNL